MSKKEDIENSYDIIAFCDNASEKIGTLFNGRPVISVEQLDSYPNESILITSSIYKYEIIKQLIEVGISEDRIQIIMPEWMSMCEVVKVCRGG